MFVDHHSQYVWFYPLRTKDQVFERFVHWKALVEKSSGKKLKTLRTDNGGEFTSTQFQTLLKTEEIQYERTITKTPQQNSVAERLNRTLVQMSRSMLLDADLSKKYWAEKLYSCVPEKPLSHKSCDRQDTI